MQRIFSSLVLTLFLTNSFCQTVAISPGALNLSEWHDSPLKLYQWIDNDLKIVVENTPYQHIVVKVDRGKIEGKGCYFVYAADNNVFLDTIRVGIRRSGKTTWISSQECRIKRISDPEVGVGASRNGDSIYKIAFVHWMAITLPVYDFGFESTSQPNRQITSYSVKVVRDGNIIFYETVNGTFLTDKLKEFIRNQTKKNDNIVFENIVALIYKREIRKLSEVYTLFVKD